MRDTYVYMHIVKYNAVVIASNREMKQLNIMLHIMLATLSGAWHAYARCIIASLYETS